MFSKAFLTATLERMIRTVAQVLLTFLGAQTVNAFDVQWDDAVGIAVGAAVVSLLMSIIASGVGENRGPSFTGAEKIEPSAELHRH